MAEALTGIYNRHHPERTDYYSPIEAFEDRRIIEGTFEEFERSYPDQFEEKYGYLRTEVMKAIYSFKVYPLAHHLYHTQDITGLFQTKPEAIKVSCSECKLFNREIFHRGAGD